jgi:hypothetical protein
MEHRQDLEKRTSLSSVDLTLLIQQIAQIARGGQTNQQNLMVSQFDLLYGDRYGVHIPDFGTYFNDWCVACDCRRGRMD